MTKKLIGLLIGCVLMSGCAKATDTKNTSSLQAVSEQAAIKDTSSDENTSITEDENEQKIAELQEKADAEAEEDRYNIIEAMGNKESDERWGNAVGFIKKQYPDYFSSKELLEKSMFYGRYLESLYSGFSKENNGRSRYYEMGKIVSDTAKEIYLRKKDVSDTDIKEQLDALEVLLQFFYDKYYGENSNY